jgi:acyl-CoA dehydrogenase
MTSTHDSVIPGATLSARELERKDAAHDFADAVMRPVAWVHDRDASWPQEVIEEFWRRGLMNCPLPTRYGGPGMSFLELCLVKEELGWGCAGMGTSLSSNGLAMMPLLLAGSDRLKDDYLTRLGEAPVLASFGLTEPSAGSDVAALRTTATKRGHGWVINGSKCFITNASHAEWFTVFARTEPGPGHRGISCFVVPRDAGVRNLGNEDLIGQRASDTAAVAFDDVEIPGDHLVGEEGRGFQLALASLDRTRTGVAALATGLSRAALEFALDYAGTRVQFGTPIAEHQAVQLLLADMATKVHLARLATHHSARLLDGGANNTLESSHAKRFAADAAMEVTTDAVQIFGGAGLVRSNPVEKLLRDAKPFQIYEGTGQIQRVVIAREELRRRASAASTS